MALAKRVLVSVASDDTRMMQDLARFPSKSGRMVSVYRRYLDICRAYRVDISPEALDCLQFICDTNAINHPFVKCLEAVIADSEAYLKGEAAAVELYNLVKSLDYASRIALIDQANR